MTNKPFFTMYVKKRSKLNPLYYVFGEYKTKWFEQDKQKKGYFSMLDVLIDIIDIDIKDVEFRNRLGDN